MTDTNQVVPAQTFELGDMKLRSIVIGNEPWFVAKDVCDVLGLTHTHKALQALDADEVAELEQYSGSGRKPLIINESGLYSLILKSRKPEAKVFKKWVTSSVLPSIRKHGIYAKGVEQFTPEQQQNIYAAMKATLLDGLRRYDRETEHHHWMPDSKRQAASHYAAQKIASETGMSVHVVTNVGMYGVDQTMQAIAEGKVKQ